MNLPPKNDTEAESLAHYDFPEGLLKFEGQEFIFPEGFSVDVIAKWLEESLLSVELEVDAVIQAECARCLKVTSLEISENLGYLYYLHSAEEEATICRSKLTISGKLLTSCRKFRRAFLRCFRRKFYARKIVKGYARIVVPILTKGLAHVK